MKRKVPSPAVFSAPANELLTAEDVHPFETVTLTRIRDHDGERTDRVEIEGLRQGGMRTRVVTYTRLLEQAEMHWEFGHGKTKANPMSTQEFAHATMRAAVAFLMD
jgi:hypothetical protein